MRSNLSAVYDHDCASIMSHLRNGMHVVHVTRHVACSLHGDNLYRVFC